MGPQSAPVDTYSALVHNRREVGLESQWLLVTTKMPS